MGFLDKLDQAKIKFKQLVLIKKKLRALQNFASCSNFEHQDFLLLVEKALAHPNAGDAEFEFLDNLLQRYNVDYLSWSHRTQCLKKEMVRIRRQRCKQPATQQYLFDMNAVVSSSAATLTKAV